MKEDHLSPHDAARALALLRPQVLASGNTGLISFAGTPHRVTLEEMDRDYPGLIDGMTGHPGVGFVMVATEHAGPVVIGARGRHYLDDGRVQGEDPLAVYGPAPGRHLLRTHGFSTGRVGGRGGQLDITPRPDHPSEGVV